MKENRIIIAGSRNCPESDLLLFNRVGKIIKDLDLNKTEIVSGTARGADNFGEWFAERVGLPVKRFPADWDTHGKKAGHIRNREMGDYGTHLIAIWDGESRGTAGMIKYAKEKGLKVRIIYI